MQNIEYNYMLNMRLINLYFTKKVNFIYLFFFILPYTLLTFHCTTALNATKLCLQHMNNKM